MITRPRLSKKNSVEKTFGLLSSDVPVDESVIPIAATLSAGDVLGF